MSRLYFQKGIAEREWMLSIFILPVLYSIGKSTWLHLRGMNSSVILWPLSFLLVPGKQNNACLWVLFCFSHKHFKNGGCSRFWNMQAWISSCLQNSSPNCLLWPDRWWEPDGLMKGGPSLKGLLPAVHSLIDTGYGKEGGAPAFLWGPSQPVAPLMQVYVHTCMHHAPHTCTRTMPKIDINLCQQFLCVSNSLS